MSKPISIHETTASRIQLGDQLARDGVQGLEHGYHTDQAGQDVTVTGHVYDRVQDTVAITLSDGDVVDALADIQVTVVRPRAQR